MALPLKLGPGRFEEFTFDELNPNVTGSTDPRVPITLTTTPSILASIKLTLTKENVVWLLGTVGYIVTDNSQPPARVVFKIWRGHPDNGGEVIFSAADSGQGASPNNTYRTSSFTHVDAPNNITYSNYCPNTAPSTTYYLTAEAIDTTYIDVIGPITFVGSEIID